jgi:hypothetical protein
MQESVLRNLVTKDNCHLFIDILVCRITFETRVKYGEEG